MVPAQRIDLELSGVDDGLHSFGQGIWMFHDHVEKAFTTNGIGEGGDISLVVYKGFYDDKGIPASHGMSLAPYFAKNFWKSKYPIWQDYDAWRSLGLPDLEAGYEPAKVAVQKILVQPGAASVAVTQQDSVATKLIYGFLLGILSYLAIIRRKSIFAIGKLLFEKSALLLPKKRR
jgi:hypothetical protein